MNKYVNAILVVLILCLLCGCSSDESNTNSIDNSIDQEQTSEVVEEIVDTNSPIIATIIDAIFCKQETKLNMINILKL